MGKGCPSAGIFTCLLKVKPLSLVGSQLQDYLPPTVMGPRAPGGLGVVGKDCGRDG